MSYKPTLIIITGPTASGKSALAVSLAKRLDTEIISADSRQIYTGIPIVTAVPTLEERDGVKHHLLEFLPLESYYSASKFREDCLNIIDILFKNKDTAIVCGGSMLYLDTLVNGIDDLPTVPDDFRMALMAEWKERGDGWLLERLRHLDLAYYNKIDHRNLKRVFHAVEISMLSGSPYSGMLSGGKNLSKLPFNVIKFCLTGDRSKLFERINLRVLKMIEVGLEEEARNVYPYRNLNSLNTVGLKEMFAMFDGVFSPEEAIARIQKNTRVYAKKQLTWHKRDNDLKYLDFSDPIQDNTERILAELKARKEN